MNNNTHYYNVNVEWKEGRTGILQSPELDDELEVATPPEFAKGVAGIWSPEHYLVAAANSCLMTTFLAIAENSKLNFTAFSSQAIGKLEIIEGKFMISEITFRPTITISHEEDREKAARIAIKSEAACLISNSLKSAIHLETVILVK
jgi:peroxiredoxin-like protein